MSSGKKPTVAEVVFEGLGERGGGEDRDKRWIEPRVKEPHAGESPEASLHGAISSVHGKLAQAAVQAWTCNCFKSKHSG